jgi:hypothetical protein
MQIKKQEVMVKLENLKERPTNFSITVPVVETDNNGNQYTRE